MMQKAQLISKDGGLALRLNFHFVSVELSGKSTLLEDVRQFLSFNRYNDQPEYHVRVATWFKAQGYNVQIIRNMRLEQGAKEAVVFQCSHGVVRHQKLGGRATGWRRIRAPYFCILRTANSYACGSPA